ncbi:MAG: cyclase family protein [Armatimonadota bacterium]
MISYKRLVDLSHVLKPGKEEFLLDLETHNVEDVVGYIKRREDVWYILQDIHMSSHVGTHIELPYHHWKTGADAAAFPLEKLIGQGCVMDFSHKKPNDIIDLDEIRGNAVQVQAGDIVFIRMDCDKLFRTDKAHDRPILSTEAAQYLVNVGINCIGTDATGVELKGTDYQPNHQLFFSNNIPIVESATNLDKLESTRFHIAILPLAVEGLDSCPVRIVAFEN